jgi:hypothetical protein
VTRIPLAAAVALVFATACQSQCERVCAAYNACDVLARPINIECQSFCYDVEQLNLRAAVGGHPGCDAKWAAHMTCWEGASSSMCQATSTVCDQSAVDWQDCVVAYCDGIPPGSSDPKCQGGGYGALSMPSPFQSQ